MRLAYLILAHNTPNHLCRLVRALDSPNAAFFIHVDRKSDIRSYRNRLSQPNITFLEDRVDVYWDGFSRVDATIRLINESLNCSPESGYLVLLSASDYPLRSPEYIEDFFSRNQGRQFINLVQMPCEAVGKPIERVQQYWLQTPYNNWFLIRVIARLNQLSTRLKLINRDYKRVFNGLLPYGGSEWWALTAEACRYILKFINARTDIVKFFRNTYMPDEAIFQTIIGNSEFAKHVARNVTFTDWSRPIQPAIIDMDHLNAFVKAGCIIGDDAYGRGELLFARKFPDDSSQLTDFIDAHLIGR
jgi:hypothetical protein